MKRLLPVALLLCAAFCGSTASASEPHSPLLVDAEWLAARVDDPTLVLLHVGEADGYAAGHIAGARHVTLDDISVSEHRADGLMLQVPDDEDLRERLQALGIGDDSRIVVYHADGWVSPATRVVFTLQVAGLGERTSLLDGGIDAWNRHGGTLDTAVPTAQRGTLSPLQMQDLVVDAADVRTQLGSPGVAVVDGRAAVYHDGIEVGGAHGQAHRRGHIRGARSLPFTEISDERLMLRPLAELRAVFDRAGVAPGDTIIGYCHIGQQATAMLFAARLLGHPIRLYDGSFEDWSRDARNPVATTAAGEG